MNSLLLILLCAGLVEAQSPTPPQPKCTTNEESIWNDVMFVFDRSIATTDQGLQELLYHVQTDVSWYTLSLANDTNANPMSMRAGIILYDTDAVLQYPLGSLDNDAFFNIDRLPFRNDPGTNLEGAIQLAVAEFNSQSHRASSRKVLVVLATTYKPGDYEDPQQAANTFKEDGGIIIVYNYVQVHGAPAEDLSKIVSPGYFCFSVNDTDGTCLRGAQSDANCFCPANYRSYENSGLRDLPMEGCYYAVPTTNNFQLATRRCSQFNSGTLAIVESKEKFQFLMQEFTSSSNFWIGLQYNTSLQAYVWPDGTGVGSYQPWGSGQPTTPSQTNACVFSPIATSFDQLQWTVSDCRNSYAFVCESSPCDSNHFCAA